MSRHRVSHILKTTLLIVLAFNFLGIAQGEDAVTIKSDSQSGSEREGMIFLGNVVFEYGVILIRSDSMKIKRAEDDSIELIAESDSTKLTEFETKDDDPEKALKAEAKKITYIHSDGTLVLEGQASIVEGMNKIEAHLIRYNTQTGEFSAEKAPDGSRVTTQIKLSS